MAKKRAVLAVDHDNFLVSERPNLAGWKAVAIPNEFTDDYDFSRADAVVCNEAVASFGIAELYEFVGLNEIIS